MVNTFDQRSSYKVQLMTKARFTVLFKEYSSVSCEFLKLKHLN